MKKRPKVRVIRNNIILILRVGLPFRKGWFIWEDKMEKFEVRMKERNREG